MCPLTCARWAVFLTCSYGAVDEKTKKVLRIASGDLPIAPTPFDAWADRAGVSPDEFIEILGQSVDRGAVRRFGAVLSPVKGGMRANAMVAWEVGMGDADRAGAVMAGFSAVTHCYLRRPAPGWPYALYTMVHAKDDAALDRTVRRIAEETGIASYVVLKTVRELKKTSPDYLGGEGDAD
jgi:DNA-binding Lrp family transcriptional regulator